MRITKNNFPVCANSQKDTLINKKQIGMNRIDLRMSNPLKRMFLFFCTVVPTMSLGFVGFSFMVWEFWVLKYIKKKCMAQKGFKKAPIKGLSF